MMDAWCGGCSGAVRDSCEAGLASVGVIKVHWECWSDCNLHCPFCFRTREEPVGSRDAERIIDAIATGGARTIAFAGGDPTLRRDLEHLVDHARRHGLRVEIQTNAQVITRSSWAALSKSHRVCLSLDGPTPEMHDAIRARPGNHRRVLRAAIRLGEGGTPITVRTVVTPENYLQVPEMAPIIRALPGCERWTLLEFTPVNEGYTNRKRYTLASPQFEATVRKVRSLNIGGAELDVFRHAEKIGAYMQVTAAGSVYGTTEESLMTTGLQRTIGSLLSDHLSDLARLLPIDRSRHADRYTGETE